MVDLKAIKRRLGLGGPLKPSESIGKVQARDSDRQSRSDEEEEFEALQRDRDSDVQQRERADELSPRPEGQSEYDRARFLVGQFHGALNRSGGTLTDSDFLDTLSDKDREAVTSYTSIGHDYGPPSQSAGYGEAAQTRQSDLESLSPTGPDAVEMQDIGPELDWLAQDDRRFEARPAYATDDVPYRGDDFGGLYQELASKGIRTERKRPADEEERIEDSRQRRMAALASDSAAESDREAKRPSCETLSPTKVGRNPSAERLSHNCCLDRLKPATEEKAAKTEPAGPEDSRQPHIAEAATEPASTDPLDAPEPAAPAAPTAATQGLVEKLATDSTRAYGEAVALDRMLNFETSSHGWQARRSSSID